VRLPGPGHQVWFPIEWIDKIPGHLDSDHSVANTHEQDVLVACGTGVVEAHVDDHHPLLPPLDGVDNVVADQPLQHGVVGLEDEVLQFGAELRLEEALARPRSRNLQDALMNVSMLLRSGHGDLRSAGTPLKAEGEAEPLAEEIPDHPQRP
jgi:hypothetical protein